MSQLNKYPLIDGFETTLAQQYTGGLGIMYVDDVPAFTFPSGVTTYVVINPGKSIQQVVEIDALGAGLVNVSNTTVERAAGVNYTAQTHAAGSKVIISDNYQFWKEIRTAINTKLDDDGSNGKEYADTAARDAALGGDGVATKNYRSIKAGSAYYNYNLSLGQRQIISTGTAPVNGSETVAGVFEQSSDAEFTAGTNTGDTGAQLVPKNSQIQTALNGVATKLVGKIYQISQNNFNL